MTRNQEIDALRSLESVILRSVLDISTGQQSLLHRAALLSDPSLIDLLVTEKSCDMNAMCFEGQTPLHYAVRVESIQVALRLMELGADQKIKT